MSEATRTDLQRALADEFGHRGWEYDMAVGEDIVSGLERSSSADSGALAAHISSTWIEKNRATRDQVANAIERAIAGRTLARDEAAGVTLNTDNRSYTLTMESGSQITGSQVNLGGTQINVRADGPKEDVLAGIAALIKAGLQGDWNPDAARELATAVEGRDDIGFQDVEAVANEVAEATDSPDPGRVRTMLASIAQEGIGGALGTGIVAGISWLLHNPAF